MTSAHGGQHPFNPLPLLDARRMHGDDRTAISQRRLSTTKSTIWSVCQTPPSCPPRLKPTPRTVRAPREADELEAPANEHLHTALVRPVGELDKQTGLADPGVADQQHHGWLALPSRFRGGQQPAELRAPPDECTRDGDGHGPSMKSDKAEGNRPSCQSPRGPHVKPGRRPHAAWHHVAVIETRRSALSTDRAPARAHNWTL